jgi:hypothetical protein
MFTNGQVQPKYFNNKDTFKPGYSTPTTTGTTTGARVATRCWLGLGAARGRQRREVARARARGTDAFARCQVQKVFRPSASARRAMSEDRDQVKAMTDSFKANGYQLKRVFAEAATYCKGD